MTNKMHADEIEIDATLVRRLLAAQFPQWAPLPLTRIASTGTDNAMFRLGDDLLIRLPRIDWAVEAVAREQAWLPRLAPHLPVKIPSPLGHGAPGESYPYPWSVYGWLEGVNPDIERLANPEALTRGLVEFITALRRIELGGPAAGRNGALAMRDATVREAISALHGMIDTPAVTAAWEAALQAPNWTGQPVWLHADLAPGNLLLVNERLSAVIDFGGVGVGDPAVDLPIAWNLLPATMRPIFRDGLQVDDAIWVRGRGWALSIALIQLPYYQTTNPPLAASARHVIRQVLADEFS